MGEKKNRSWRFPSRRSFHILITFVVVILLALNSSRLFPNEDTQDRVLVVQIDSRELSLQKVPYDHNVEHCPLEFYQRFNYTATQKSIVQCFLWAQEFQYDYIYVKTHATNRDKWKYVWDRTWVLPKIMDNYPKHYWILYLDADLFPLFPLRGVLEDIEAQASLKKDFYMTAFDEGGTELNAGIILFKNNVNMRSIFDLWATAIEKGMCPESLRKGGYCEQECMKSFLMKEKSELVLPYFQNVKYHTRVFFHCFGSWMKMVHCGARCGYDVNLNKMNITNATMDETLLKVKENHVIYMDKDINESPKGY